MATVVNQTRVGAPFDITGGIYVAPVGTPLPTDVFTPLNDDFKITGLIGEDGLTESPTRETNDIKAWGGHLARVLQSDYAIEVTLTYIERTETSLKEVYGDDNVTIRPKDSSTLTSIVKNAQQLPNKSRVAEMLDGQTKIRLVYPNCQIVNVGESKYAGNDLIAYPVTIKCYPDENGNYGYEYESESK